MDGYVTIGTNLDLSGIEKKLDQMASMMEKKTGDAAEKAAAASSKKLARGMTVGISVLSRVVDKIMNAVSNSLDSAIGRVDTMNNFSTVMKNLGQSSNDAEQSVDYLAEKLSELPTTLDAAVSGVQQFTSANNNVKASTEMFLALNNAILAGGAPMEQQQSALYNLTRAYSAHNIQADQWYSLMAAAPAQMNQVAEAMGLGKNNAEALGEGLRKGTISLNDFMTTLVKLNKGQIEGFTSLEEQALAATGGIRTSLANLKNAVVKGVAEVIQTIGQTNIANFFESIRQAIKATIPYIAAFVKSFMAAVVAVGKIIGTIASAIGGLFGKKSKGGAKEFSADLSSSAISMGNLGSGAGTASKNLGKAAKSAKEVKKQLAGFDEMNVLQDTTSSAGGSGGAGGADVGGLGDLGGLGDFNLGDLTDKIKSATFNTDLFTAAVWGLIGAFAAWKLGTFLKDIGAFPKILGEMSKADILTKAIGIGAIISGLVIGIKGVIDYLKDPTWENFAKILAGIALIVAGLALVFSGTAALIGAIVLVVAAVGIAVYKNWDKIKEVLGKVGDWIKTKVIDPVVNFFKGLWETIKAIFSPVIEFYKNIFTTIITNIKTMISNVKQILTALWTAIKAIFGPVFQWIYDKIIKPISDKFTALWTGIKNGVTSAVDKVKSVFSGVINFFKNIVSSIVSVFTTIGSKVGNAIGKAFKGAINVVLSVIENVLNTPIRTINSLISVINALPGVKLKSLSTFKLPRLAKGGIINQPGRGVMVGSAIAGERGAEGVIPLTDSQQMAILGEAIGRYITVNANITNTMNGRVISRELQKVQNESDFAFNR